MTVEVYNFIHSKNTEFLNFKMGHMSLTASPFMSSLSLVFNYSINTGGVPKN